MWKEVLLLEKLGIKAKQTTFIPIKNINVVQQPILSEILDQNKRPRPLNNPMTATNIVACAADIPTTSCPKTAAFEMIAIPPQTFRNNNNQSAIKRLSVIISFGVKSI